MKNKNKTGRETPELEGFRQNIFENFNTVSNDDYKVGFVLKKTIDKLYILKLILGKYLQTASQK